MCVCFVFFCFVFSKTKLHIAVFFNEILRIESNRNWFLTFSRSQGHQRSACTTIWAAGRKLNESNWDRSLNTVKPHHFVIVINLLLLLNIFLLFVFVVVVSLSLWCRSLISRFVAFLFFFFILFFSTCHFKWLVNT